LAPDQRIASPPSDGTPTDRRYRRFSSYRALLAAGILGPLLLFAAIAWWSWERVSQEVEGDISRTADMLHEHAERLVQLDALLLDQIDRRLGELGWDEILRQDGPIDATLASITAQVADVDGVFVADAAGQLRLLIRGHPTPARSPLPPNTDVRDRSSYKMARDGAVLTLDGPFKSRVTGRPVFQLSRRLANPDGSFRGVAVLAVSPQRLIDFWQGIVDPGDTISLIRKDGVVIARYPEIPLRADQPPLRFSQAFVERIQTMDTGGADITSAIDGIERLNGFRKLRDLPIYIVYAVDKRNIAV
jgi:hypothetical protein